MFVPSSLRLSRLPMRRDLTGRSTATLIARPRFALWHWLAPRGLVQCQRGSIHTEYVILVGVVGIATAAAVFALGPRLLSAYEQARDVILLPIP